MGRIVIVDDNLFLQKAIAEKLSFFDDLNCKFAANNGLDLLKKLEENHNVDLILMDIEMPKMDGIEATYHIKTKYPHIKIIMLTAFDNDENIFKSIKAGADGYLLKEAEPTHTALEYGNSFNISWEDGQKTGFFVDQRENRNLLAS